MRETDPVYRAEALATHETDKAIRVELDNGIVEWIPKTHIHPDSQVQSKGDHGELVCSLWIAQQKGWA